jgi:hypothetical protein
MLTVGFSGYPLQHLSKNIVVQLGRLRGCVRPLFDRMVTCGLQRLEWDKAGGDYWLGDVAEELRVGCVSQYLPLRVTFFTLRPA